MKKSHYILMSFTLSFSAYSLASEEMPTNDGNALENSLWTITDIPVCWENFDEIPTEEQEWVKNAVAGTWEAKSSVKFTGWDACTTNSAGIRILVEDSALAPHVKTLGSYLDGYTNGMVLNHTYSNWSTSCQWKKQYCSEVIAVHEFGHALGFSHEQNRPDSPESCTDAPEGTDGDLYVGEWDLDSIMNYCNPAWNNAGILSDTDIEMMQLFYGEAKDIQAAAPVEICAVTSSSDDGNVAANTLDGDLDTRWSANSSYEWLDYTLCEATTIDRIDIAWFKGDQRSAYYDIYYTLTDGTSYFPSGARISSGTSSELETEYITAKEISKLRLRGFGNSVNTWNSISEVVIYSKALQADYPELNTASSLTAALNGNDIELSWTDTSTDEDGYIIETQVDGSDFEIVATTAPSTTSFTHTGLQLFGDYTYRVTAYSGILRSNYTEVVINRPGTANESEEMTSVSITPVSASASSDDGNIAENVIDGDFDTRWSANGEGEYVTLTLGQSYFITGIRVAWYKGDERQTRFQIEVSDDNATWTQVFDGINSGETLWLETTNPIDTSAQYIRIIGLGNEDNAWNSITEVSIVGYAD